MKLTDLDSYAVIESNLDTLVTSLLESKYMDPKVMKEKICLFVQLLALDLMKSQEDDVEKEIKLLTYELNEGNVKGRDFTRLTYNLQRLNIQKKTIRRGYHKIKEYNEYLLLKKFLRLKYGEEAFKEFLSWQKEALLNLDRKLVS